MGFVGLFHSVHVSAASMLFEVEESFFSENFCSNFDLEGSAVARWLPGPRKSRSQPCGQL